MCKRQTKDKHRIDELENKINEQSAEITRLQGVISYLENPFPYELSVMFQEQQIACARKMDEERSRFNYIHGLGRRAK